MAHSLGLCDGGTLDELVKAYEKIDRLAVIPIHQELAINELVGTGAQHYRRAARRLVKMRRLAAGSERAPDVEHFIADLREEKRRRSRLKREVDQAGLP